MGNICRSPMAEGIVRHIFKERGIQAETDSCGTGAWHAGEPPDYRAQKEVRKHGIDISDLRARKFQIADFDRFDYIFTMDSQNYSDIISLAENDEQRAKVDMFLNIAEPGSNKSVPDPYYGGDEGFRRVYEMIRKNAEILAGKIENNEL